MRRVRVSSSWDFVLPSRNQPIDRWPLNPSLRCHKLTRIFETVKWVLERLHKGHTSLRVGSDVVTPVDGHRAWHQRYVRLRADSASIKSRRCLFSSHQLSQADSSVGHPPPRIYSPDISAARTISVLTWTFSPLLKRGVILTKQQRYETTTLYP